jgi:hypothetical protein
MFKISPIQDENTKQKYAKECGTNAIDGYFAYQMIDLDTGLLMAFSQFEISKNEGYISDLLPRISLDDYEAMFILGRQTMNFIDSCGAHICRAKATAGDEKLLLAIGFKKLENGEYYADMSNMFNGHCDN